MAAKKDDPTMTSDAGDVTVGAAPPVDQADDHAGDREYKDNPDKPDPSTVAQVEVVEDKHA